MCIGILPAFMFVYRVCRDSGGWKQASDPPELELEIVVSHGVSAGD